MIISFSDDTVLFVQSDNWLDTYKHTEKRLRLNGKNHFTQFVYVLVEISPSFYLFRFYHLNVWSSHY